MLQSAIFLSVLTPLGLHFIIKGKTLAEKFLIVVSLSILVFALSAIIFSLKINKVRELNYPTFKTSSQILMATLKQNPVFGIGSGNFLESFNKFRPIEYNYTSIWANKFNYGASFILTLTTETGTLGIFVFIGFIASVIVSFTKTAKKVSVDLLSLVMILIFSLIFPISNLNLILLFVILAIFTEVKKYDYPITNKVILAIIITPLLILILLATYKISILFYAEYNYSKALKFVSENKAREAYDSLQKAINGNPKVDRYHKIMSSINLAIANSLNDSDQSPFFVQEAINEAKATVALNNKKSDNWETLAKTYKLLTPFASGADQFAIDAYKQAISLNPTNPSLRISLGEIYMFKKDYKLAIETFELAVLAKEDYPNAHFNLALAYRDNGDIKKAKQELNKTLSLLEIGSEDYKKAKLELDNLK